VTLSLSQLGEKRVQQFGGGAEDGMLIEVRLKIGHDPHFRSGILLRRRRPCTARMQAPAQTFAPDPDKVRRRLAALLDQACQAKAMPWSERDARMWQTVFPQMAGWLPDDEANQMRLDFSREMDRLRAA
jgi:hypothetical protein